MVVLWQEWCMQLYTCPDKYVILPAAAPAPTAARKAPEAVVIDRSFFLIELSDTPVYEP